MDSITFIAEAGDLVKDIKSFQASWLTPEDERVQGIALQKRVDHMFGVLQNPTLPSAYKLRDAALGAGFAVDQKRQHWLSWFENIRG